MMDILHFVILVLATWQTVEIVHHSELFAERRDTWAQSKGFFSRLAVCPHCLSVWVAGLWTAWLIYAYMMFSIWTPMKPATFYMLCWPMYLLAVSRAANLANDVTYSFCRTPREIEVFTPPDTGPKPLVVCLIDGVVDKVYVCEPDEVESKFITECRARIPEWDDYDKEEVTDILNNGYIEYENYVVCITWPIKNGTE